jgi:hypothetical protein
MPEKVKRWDWPLAFSLYCAGMGPKEIANLPEFRGLSEKSLANAIVKQGWAKAREKHQMERAVYLTSNLQEARKVAIEKHYKFLLQEVELERKVIEQRVKTGKTNEQTARLEILKRYVELAEKALGIEGEKTGDPKRDGDRWLIAIQVNGESVPVKTAEEQSPTSGFNPLSAIVTLPTIKNAAQGHVEPGNGMSETHHKADNEQNPEKTPDSTHQPDDFLINPPAENKQYRNNNHPTQKASRLPAIPPLNATPEEILFTHRGEEPPDEQPADEQPPDEELSEPIVKPTPRKTNFPILRQRPKPKGKSWGRPKTQNPKK